MGTRILKIALLALAVAAGPLAGCGPKAKPPRRTQPPKPKKKHAPVAQVDVVKPNPEWRELRPFFNRFMENSISGFKDPFRPHILDFAGTQEFLDKVKGELAGAEDAKAAAPEGSSELPRGPLQQYPAQSYKPIIIETGLAEPKAVLTGPGRETFVVTKDTYVGNEGGYVEDITQYYVVIKVPTKDEPIVMSLKPEILNSMQAEGHEYMLTITPNR